MTLKIKLTAAIGSSKGVDFNADFKSFFSGFVSSGWPYILGGNSIYAGDEIVLLDKIRKGAEASTRAIVLDGKNFNYYFNDHTLSGTLTTVRLSTLGDSYNKADGSFDTDDDGHIANVRTPIEISGLNIYNAVGVSGKVHDVIYGLMGGGTAGEQGTAKPAALQAFIWAEAHDLVGSSGADTYTGTKFADTVNGNGGKDLLNGALGNDRIYGGSGNDTLIGGAGADLLNGGSGGDAASYAGASRGVVANLSKPSYNTNDARGDIYVSVEHLIGSSSADKLYGNSLANVLLGGLGNDHLEGGAGNDVLKGHAGNDTLYGGSGLDDVYGSTGKDVFVFRSVKDLGVSKSATDTIFDFSQSQADRIDLSGIDANLKTTKNDAFLFVGTKAFTKVAGQLRYDKTSTDAYVHGDTNGDGKADFVLHLDTSTTLKAGDFVL